MSSLKTLNATLRSTQSRTTAQKELACTLRYLFLCIQYLEVPLVAIEFSYRGTTWRADTPEEAVRLRNELQRNDTVSVPEHESIDLAAEYWTPDRFMDVIEGIGDLQLQFLAAIRSKSGITSKELVSALAINSEVALAGVISGISKQLKKLHIEPSKVFVIRVDWSGKTKNRTFILDDFFVAAAIEQNWPDAWNYREVEAQ